MQTFELKNNRRAMRQRLRGEIDAWSARWDGKPLLELDPRNPDTLKPYRAYLAFRDEVQAELVQEAEEAQLAAAAEANRQQQARQDDLRALVDGRMDKALAKSLDRATKALQQAQAELAKARADLSAVEASQPEPSGAAIVAHRRKRQELTELVDALEALAQEAQASYDYAYSAYHEQREEHKRTIYEELRQQRLEVKARFEQDDRTLAQRMGALGQV
jgi:hypothetical protein